MAGIDHTIIAFKNGKLMKETVQFRDDECLSLVPFSYNRDGQILGYELGRGYSYPAHGLREKLASLLTRADADVPTYYSYIDKNVEIILCALQDCNVTFYLDARDTYVMLGGYGHYHNPYTHFYKRGYGEEFERKMATECYEWLCENVLKDALESLPQYSGELEHHLRRLQLRLGFRSFWSLSEEERRHYNERRIGVFEPPQFRETDDADQLFPILIANRA